MNHPMGPFALGVRISPDHSVQATCATAFLGFLLPFTPVSPMRALPPRNNPGGTGFLYGCDGRSPQRL